MNTEKLNHQLDDLRQVIEEARERKELTRQDLNKISTRYERLYESIKLQLAFIGQRWTVMLKDKHGFLYSVPGVFISEAEAEKAAQQGLSEEEHGVAARLYCDGVFIREI